MIELNTEQQLTHFRSLQRQYKILNVPLSSHLAANHFNQQQAEQEERMRMKKLTLDINERQEQEDYQGAALPTAA